MGGTPCTVEECSCKDPAFQAASRSPCDATNFVLCAKLDDAVVNGPMRDLSGDWSVESPRWLTPAGAKKPFSCHTAACLEGTHKEGPFLNQTRACGWAKKTSPSCMVEYSADIFWWKRWEPRETSKNRETGEAVMTMEFSPVSGTRKEFMAEYGAQLEFYMPHIHLVRLARVNLKLRASS